MTDKEKLAMVFAVVFLGGLFVFPPISLVALALAAIYGLTRFVVWAARDSD